MNPLLRTIGWFLLFKAQEIGRFLGLMVLGLTLFALIVLPPCRRGRH